MESDADDQMPMDVPKVKVSCADARRVSDFTATAQETVKSTSLPSNYVQVKMTFARIHCPLNVWPCFPSCYRCIVLCRFMKYLSAIISHV